MHVLWTAKDESLIRIVIWRNVIGLFIIWNYRAERSNHPSVLVLWSLFPFDCAVLMSAAGLQECLQCLCWSSLSSQGPIVCYLCKEEIKADLWYSGDHRWASHYKVRLWSARSTGEAVPAGRQCSSLCCPLTRRWTAHTVTGDWGCGQIRRWPSPATSASTRAPQAGTWSGHQTQRKVKRKIILIFSPQGIIVSPVTTLSALTAPGILMQFWEDLGIENQLKI